ncbi:2-amino-4-hydroxy-6-hydroxymethyldihydropteridine diphosphokinase [Listeria costaricensis]|uniref:2-amino-4-hydroxy-6- hydroxymethyldihydropteridine diphosphokinase n=1 Tax=Listeria costaricensis TaxID=2026604 RepID=UPI000C06A65E|nr:2-amino-4-hydroxy-6-hydroxymethyldihydropteridine diphosphokinase [Listeria costaricensis]
MAKAYLSLGTNIGEKTANLQHALELLKKSPAIQIKRVSSIYETDPVGYEEQDNFYNIVISIETTYTAEELLDFCLAAEIELGRVRLFKWGPRLIDIDLLTYENETRETEKLTLPHPYMTERAFVMIPFMEIAPEDAAPFLLKEKIAAQNIYQTDLQLKW